MLHSRSPLGTLKRRRCKDDELAPEASAQKREKALDRLELALRAVSREDRQRSVEQLPHSIRCALLAFMKRRGVAEKSKQEFSKAIPRERTKKGGWLEKVKRSSGLQYRVRESFLGLEVKTQYVSSLQKALEIMSLMGRLRTALLSDANTRTDGAASAFSQDREPQQRLKQELLGMPEFGLQLRFCFKAVFTHMGTRVEGPPTGDFDAALRHRKELQAAARKGWAALRELLVQLHQLPTRRRLRCLSAQEAAVRVDRAFRRSPCSGLQGAIRAVKRALESEASRVSRATATAAALRRVATPLCVLRRKRHVAMPTKL